MFPSSSSGSGNQADESIKRLQRIARNLTTAVVIIAIADVLLLIVDLAV
jgi:hypothetical protein